MLRDLASDPLSWGFPIKMLHGLLVLYLRKLKHEQIIKFGKSLQRWHDWPKTSKFDDDDDDDEYLIWVNKNKTVASITDIFGV
jgi:hypothetical protein